MDVGLVGLSYVGKTTLFSALTGSAGEVGGAMKAGVGVANIPDPRLDLIARHVPTKKIVPATLRLVDAPGLTPAGAGAESTAGKVLACVREVDALCHVVRCFDPGGQPPAPERDIDAFESELILADLQVVENALPRAERSARSREKKALDRLEVLKKVGPWLEEARPVRSAIAQGALTAQEQAVVRELGLVSAKRVLYVANVGEDDLAGAGAAASAVRDRARADAMESVSLCASLEVELSRLDEPDRAEMLEGLGIAEPALPALARGLFRLLGLQCFYTAGEKEVRAWTIRAGATAPQAAGAIHSDLERGFIRAEVYSVADLEELKSEKAIKEAGRLRVEGKAYAMRDGDVAHFLFNV
ncbi:MAG: redox-regulated ATPase YchF [Planctomycetota bacterium]|nr:MAG: redox-regulated ATPase YchF [Planctomycetota bacterium]